MDLSSKVPLWSSSQTVYFSGGCSVHVGPTSMCKTQDPLFFLLDAEASLHKSPLLLLLPILAL